MAVIVDVAVDATATVPTRCATIEHTEFLAVFPRSCLLLLLLFDFDFDFDAYLRSIPDSIETISTSILFPRSRSSSEHALMIAKTSIRAPHSIAEPRATAR